MEELADPRIKNSTRLQDAEKIVERYEGWTRKLRGFPAALVTAVAAGSSLFFLYAAPTTMIAQILRGVFLMLTLFLTLLLYPAAKGQRRGVPWYDWALALLSLAPILYMLWDFDEFIYRMVAPDPWDLAMGLILIGVILEAIRRTGGWVLCLVVFAFLVYAYAGQYLPAPWNHRGYDLERIVGRMYMTLEGIFGVPIDVAATFIILFTIYGSFLDKSGAGQFFIDFSFSALGGKPHAGQAAPVPPDPRTQRADGRPQRRRHPGQALLAHPVGAAANRKSHRGGRPRPARWRVEHAGLRNGCAKVDAEKKIAHVILPLPPGEGRGQGAGRSPCRAHAPASRKHRGLPASGQREGCPAYCNLLSAAAIRWTTNSTISGPAISGSLVSALGGQSAL